MAVRQIVANLPVSDPAASAAFWKAVLEVEIDEDRGFIAYIGPPDTSQMARVAVVAAAKGDVPIVSFEVDDFDATLARAINAGAPIVYGPVNELWGMRRFFMCDPDGNLISIVQL